MGSTAAQHISIIAQGTVIHGDLEAAGHILVEGRVDGPSSIKGMLTVGAGGVIDGDVRADVVVIEGRVNGNITASERLELHETAVVEGDVLAPNLVIKSGAVINGTSRMQHAPEPVRALPSPTRVIGGAMRRLASA